MTELEDRLQAHLEDLESGNISPENTPISRDDDGELTTLFTLAAAVKRVEQPEIPTQRVRSMRSSVLKHAQQSRLKKSPQRKSWWRTPAFAGAFLASAFGIVIFTALLAGLIWRFGFQTRQVVTFTERDGIVEINVGSESGGWHKVTALTQLDPGTSLRTGPGSSATLRFSDGSHTNLEANTEIVLTTLAKEDDSLQVELTQRSGKTIHQVEDLVGDLAYFLVNTPGGTTRVRGTKFQVSVDQIGTTRVAVGKGKVDFLGDGGEILLNPGQVTTVLPGASPSPPAYQFSGQGMVQSIVGTEWVIGGVVINVLNQTVIHGSPGVDDNVQVSGRILDDGLWLADEILAGEDLESFFVFAGVLDSNVGDIWQISGFPIVITADTTVDPDLQGGETVRVKFFVTAGGNWQAIWINRLDDLPEDPDPTPAPTPDPEAQPSLSFTPDELESTACIQNYTFPGTLLNTGDPPDDYAANVQLGYVLIKGDSFVESVLIEPNYWETIPGGAQVSFNVTINMLDTWLQAPEETEVKLRIFIADEVNRPDHHRTRLTVTAILQCEATPVPTTPPPPDPSPSPTPTPSPTPDPDDTTNCTGSNPHPTGTRLAAQYGVSYQEIMGWFCSGFGFGEIERAYDLEIQSGVPVEQIFGMKSSGMGWGNIKKELNPKEKPPKDK